MITVKNAQVFIDPAQKRVDTHLGEGFQVGATRDETPENIQEAEEQGYTGPDRVWTSLVEHELLHILAPSVLFGEESLVLLHESGKRKTRYALRLYEEAIVLSFQYYRNTGRRDYVLTSFSLKQLDSVELELAELIP